MGSNQFKFMDWEKYLYILQLGFLMVSSQLFQSAIRLTSTELISLQVPIF
ncbi:hypothetical protein HanIR_Chr09g0431921 [Helianthus annuus]|nr:hypothetical protein HanIR_Chr09g0431921 [Helianthus annuus]